MLWSLLYATGPGYLKAMDIPLLRGRYIGQQDMHRGSHIVVIDDVMARTVFPNEDALGQSIVIADLSGGLKQGASTITMQVARDFFLTKEKLFSRKLTEVMLAYKIERALTKDQILELYMNQIYLGQRAYGFSSAARIYFG